MKKKYLDDVITVLILRLTDRGAYLLHWISIQRHQNPSEHYCNSFHLSGADYILTKVIHVRSVLHSCNKPPQQAFSTSKNSYVFQRIFDVKSTSKFDIDSTVFIWRRKSVEKIDVVSTSKFRLARWVQCLKLSPFMIL